MDLSFVYGVGGLVAFVVSLVFYRQTRKDSEAALKIAKEVSSQLAFIQVVRQAMKLHFQQILDGVKASKQVPEDALTVLEVALANWDEEFNQLLSEVQERQKSEGETPDILCSDKDQGDDGQG